jgi:hypothetical protein
MKRALVPVLLLLAPVALAGEAAAKVAPERAEVCTAAGCTTHSLGADERSFTLLGPTMQIGRRTPPPAKPAGEQYRVTLFTQPGPGPGPERIALEYFPQTGYIHVLGAPGAHAAGAVLNVGWVRLRGHEQRAYEGLLTPPATDQVASGSSDDGDPGPPWLFLGVAAGAIALIGATTLLLRRRREGGLPLHGPTA